jgi:hypothetical protein
MAVGTHNRVIENNWFYFIMGKQLRDKIGFNHKILIPVVLVLCLYGCGVITWTNGYSLTRAEKNAFSYKIMNNQKLGWTHFTGPPDHSAPWAAAIYWRIFYTTDSSYNYSLAGEDGEGYTEPNLKVYYAIGEQSRVKPRLKNDNVLNHEEGHLDIAKMCALDFQKTVQLLKPIRQFNCRGKLDSVHNVIIGKCNHIQNMYDVETNHGLNEKNKRCGTKKLPN